MFGLIPFRINSIDRLDAFDDIDSMFSSFMQNFFNDDFINMENINGNFKANIRETDNEYLVEAELPGVNKEDIALDYDNDNLVIKARRNETIENNRGNFAQSGTVYGEFSRSFHIDNVDRNGIQARFRDGRLQIIMPKLNKTKSYSSRIEIQ